MSPTDDGAPRGEAHEGGQQTPASERAEAPDPDHPSKPESPTQVPKPGWKYTARKALREFQRDQCTDLAAALTYWGVLAIAPTLLAIVSLLGVFGGGAQTVERLLTFGEELGLPDDALGTIQPILEGITGRQGAGIGAIVAVLIALWSASGFVNAFARAMNRIYEIDEGRPFVKLRGKLYVVTALMIVLVVIIVVLMVLSGGVAEAVGSMIGLGSTAVLVWDIAKWPVVAILVATVIAILYYFTPNVQQPKFRWVSVGSVVALVVWALATLGLALYLANFGGGDTYAATYGALAGVIIFLLWLWITNNALLLGAEVDAELERSRQLVAGIEAEEVIQLPPRDTAASDKKQAKYLADVEDGKELRLAAEREAAKGPDGTPAAERRSPQDTSRRPSGSSRLE